MNDYAIIKYNGQQFKVSKGDEILVGNVGKEKHEPEVLLMVKKGKVSIGKPKVKGAKVSLEVVNETEKGEKIQVMKFRSKSRYRKKIGFRPKYTRLRVEKLS